MQHDTPDAGTLQVGDSPEDEPIRHQIVRLVQHLPGFSDAVRKLSSSDTFRVLISEGNVHLFKQAADGTYKPYLRDGRYFVENVDLVKTAPDYAGAVANLLLMINMASIAADLQAIKAEVRDINQLISNKTRGTANGAMSALRQARALSDPSERRQRMLSACSDLAVELHGLAGQLKAHARAMPDEKTGFFDGFFGSGLDDAKAKYAEVELDIAVLKEGSAALLRAYAELGEVGAVRTALLDIAREVGSASLNDACRKARLVPVNSTGIAPELILKSFNDAILAIEERVLAANAVKPLEISMDVAGEELTS